MNTKKNRYTNKYNLGGKMMYRKGGSFPDLTGDGKITQADILKGRGVFKEGGMKDPNSGITALRKVAPDVVKKMGYRMGGRMMYSAGGIKYMNGGLPQYNPRNVFQSGGSVYSDNTVQSAGQGAVGSTSNIVYQENDPKLQAMRMQQLENTSENLRTSGKQLEQDLIEEAKNDQINIQTAKEKSDAKINAVSQTLGGLGEAAKQSGIVDKKDTSLGVKSAISGYKAVGDARKTLKGIEGFNTAKSAFNVTKGAGSVGKGFAGAASDIGSAGIKTAGTFGQGANIAGTSGVSAFGSTAGGLSNASLGSSSLLTTTGSSGQLIGSSSTQALAGTSKLGAAGSALNNANVYSLAANLAGKGIKSLSDDDDATTWTAGEATGDVLGTAGEYAGYGATLGSVVPGVGNAVGAVGGAIIGTGVGLYKGFTGRKKAREEEKRLETEKKKKVNKYNKELLETVGNERARVNAGQLKQKSYSGYDLGQNIVARRGGYRNMPQYI